MIPYNKNLNKIKTYVPGKSGSNSKKKEIKLSSNESAIEFSTRTKKINSAPRLGQHNNMIK